MLNLDSNVRNLFPTFYDGIKNIDVLAESEKNLFETALEKLNQTWKNQFILKCDVSGIERFEKILGIKASPSTEDLEFRRSRVLLRYNQSPPFSYPKFKERLDELLGVGMWRANLDYATRTLTVESSAESQAWAHEIVVFVSQFKPCNLVFASKPKLTSKVTLSETITSSRRKNNYILGVSWFLGSEPFAMTQRRYNYQLGKTWVLGNTPFVTAQNEEVIKMAQQSSVKPQMLINLADFTSTNIVSVLLNDSYRIPAERFEDAFSTGDETYIRYLAPADAGLGAITNVKMFDSEDRLLEEATIYVDNTFDVAMQHTIKFKEGLDE